MVTGLIIAGVALAAGVYVAPKVRAWLKAKRAAAVAVAKSTAGKL